MPLRLTLSGRNIRECTIGCDSETVVFKVSTSEKGTLLNKQTVTTITRYNPYSGDQTIIGEIERNRFKADRIRTRHFVPQMFISLDKYLAKRKSSWYGELLVL